MSAENGLDVSAPEYRADALLREYLSAGQRATLDAFKAFAFTGASGARYAVVRGVEGVFALEKNDYIARLGWLLAPRWAAVPSSDQALAAYLSAVTDDLRMRQHSCRLGVANRRHLPRGCRAGERPASLWFWAAAAKAFDAPRDDGIRAARRFIERLRAF